MGSKTQSLPNKKGRFAFVCEDCESPPFRTDSQLRDHTSEQHPNLSTACKCGAGFLNVEKLNQHRQRCPLRYGSSRNKIKKAVLENENKIKKALLENENKIKKDTLVGDLD